MCTCVYVRGYTSADVCVGIIGYACVYVYLYVCVCVCFIMLWRNFFKEGERKEMEEWSKRKKSKTYPIAMRRKCRGKYGMLSNQQTKFEEKN